MIKKLLSTLTWGFLLCLPVAAIYGYVQNIVKLLAMHELSGMLAA